MEAMDKPAEVCCLQWAWPVVIGSASFDVTLNHKLQV